MGRSFVLGGYLAGLGFATGRYEMNANGYLRYYKQRLLKIYFPTFSFVWIVCFLQRPTLFRPIQMFFAVSRVMRKIDFGIWKKSITGGASAPLGYLTAVKEQRVKGGISRSACP